ncbi:MAG: hypothetical protein WC685_13430 [Methylobacter sp.]|jgi:hypothetical protein
MDRIPGSQVSIIDSRTGMVSREWYRFLTSLYTLTGSGNNNVGLVDVQSAPIAREPKKSRYKVLPVPITVGASPFYYMNNTGGDVDAIVQGGTVSDVQYSRDGITFYSIALRAMCRLSPYDWIGIVYTVAPTLLIIPR